MSLAESLAADGYEVWTPIETTTKRLPRSNFRRQVRQPILPSYVFARVKHLVELLALERAPGRASFHVMRSHLRIPAVADADLVRLRRLEEKKTPIKRAPYSFPRNAATRITDGPFQGLHAVVVTSNGLKTKLEVTLFGKVARVEIPTTMLELSSFAMAA